MAFVRSCQKLLTCLAEPMSAGSKTDTPLVKGEPIRNGGSASVITYLRRKKTKSHCADVIVAREEQSENMEEEELCRHQGLWRRRGRSTRAEIALQS